MSQGTALQERADKLRQQTIHTIDQLLARCGPWELPRPAEELGLAQHKLRDNTYKVLVVGEAKRGKSSFINALIGRDILPTNVEVATSQVFEVRRAEKESYCLRFEDDSEQEITLGDLGRYGSQVVQDVEGPPRLDQIIRWIEVGVPAKFIPPNIRILDTPGLGALYAAHAQITQRFVPHADAVLFVLDSASPVGQPEIEFLEQILLATRRIFFIQTKIDLFRREDWQAIQERNQQILADQFRGRLEDTRVWPISSTNLRKAADTGEEAYLMVSRHKELAAALQAFLFRVSGWARTTDAVIAARDYHAQCSQVLSARLTFVTEEAKQKTLEMQQEMQRRKIDFDSQWGANSTRRKELTAQIQRICNLGKQQMRQALLPGGQIERDARDRIDALTTIEAAKALGQSLSEDLVARTVKLWQGLCQAAAEQAGHAVEPFAVALDELGQTGKDKDGKPRVDGDLGQEPAGDLWAMLTTMRTGLMTGVGVGATAGYLGSLGLIAMGISLTWLAPAAAVAGALWGVARGYQSGAERELKQAKEQLTKHVGKVMAQVRAHFLEVDMASGRAALVDDYFSQFEKGIKERVDAVALSKSEEVKGELQRLADALKMDNEQRTAQAAQMRERIAEWVVLGNTITGTARELAALDAAFGATASAGGASTTAQKSP